MSASARLADRLRRTIAGPMWHGPAVGELLAGVSPAEAAAHPVAGAHGVWELVLHMAAWAEIAAERLDGRAIVDPPADVDWPPVPADADAPAWAAAQARLAVAYESLAARAASLAPGPLAERVPGLEYTVATMLDGVVEHGAYHGGQLALLRRTRAATTGFG